MNLFHFKNDRLEIDAPINGLVKNLSEGKDPVFAEELMGPGCVIEPKSNKIYAPFSGEIVSLFPTKHAIGLRSKNGIEVIIHIGVDTVELKGELFKGYVKKDQQVKKGDILVECDFEEMKKRNIITDIFLVLPDQKKTDLEIKYGSIKVGEKLISVAR